MQYLFGNAGSGELFEDIVRHELHDIFWCYGFERDVAQYKKIMMNQKANELSYTSFYLKSCFIIIHISIQEDQVGLLSVTRDPLVVHRYFRFVKHSYIKPMKKKKF